MSKAPLGIAGLLTLAGLLYFGVPFVGCWQMKHRFDRYIHVQVEMSSCGAGPSQEPLRPCLYIFSFEGADTSEDIQFAGADLHHSYIPETRTYNVTGIGRIIHLSNVIDLSPTNIVFKGQTLPRGTQPSLVFVKSNGQLLSGYCDVGR
jgi:hypothetical protein